MVVKLKPKNLRKSRKKCFKCRNWFVKFKLRSNWSNLCKECRSNMVKRKKLKIKRGY